MIEIFTTPDGLTLSYERRGSGPLLVCHPGGPGGSAAEFEDFAGLDDTFELVLFSPRGSHGSDPGRRLRARPPMSLTSRRYGSTSASSS